MKKHIKHMHMARRKMSHVIDEIYTSFFRAGGREVDLHLTREDNGLRLLVAGDYTPENQHMMERMAEMLQPELRRALEQLGRTNLFASLVSFENGKDSGGRFSDKTMQELVKACFEMGRARTGALIVIEQNQSLGEYERTGIEVDALLTSQLLINIFEHNTPLHDGAIIVRGNRIISATCYLPLSDNMGLSKELGTRHRAGVGISEVTDSLTIVVSEETGHVSVAYEGQLYRNLDTEELRGKLRLIQNKPIEEKKRRLWKGRSKNEKEVDN